MTPWIVRSAMLLAALALAGCQPPAEAEKYRGEWVGTNYQCPIGVFYREAVEIKVDGNVLVATKLEGDACVPAGQVTFSGTLDSITCVTGLPTDPSSGSYVDIIHTEQNAGFSTCGVLFERASQD